MEVWLSIVRVVNSIVLFMLSVWVFHVMKAIFGDGSGAWSEMDVFHRLTLTVTLLIAFIFTLLVYPICNYLEKKLND